MFSLSNCNGVVFQHLNMTGAYLGVAIQGVASYNVTVDIETLYSTSFFSIFLVLLAFVNVNCTTRSPPAIVWVAASLYKTQETATGL